MSVKIFLHIDKSGMPRSGAANKPLVLLMDGAVHEDVGWGQTLIFEVSAGSHHLALQYKQNGTMSETLSLNASDGEILTLSGAMDMDTGTLTLSKEDHVPLALEKKRPLARRVGAFKVSVIVVFLIGAFSLGVGCVISLLQIDFLWPKSDGLYLIICGLIFGALGWFVRKESSKALSLAIFLYSWDTVHVVFRVFHGNSSMLGNLIIHIILFSYLIHGWNEIKPRFQQFEPQKPLQRPALTPADRPCSECGANMAGAPFCPSCGNPAPKETQKQQPAKKGMRMQKNLPLLIVAGLLAVFLITQKTPLTTWYDALLGLDDPVTDATHLSMGAVDGRTYQNSYFGIRFTIPEGLVIATPADMADLYGLSPDYYRTPMTKSVLRKLTDEKNLYFACATEYPLKAAIDFNANFQFGCEKIPADSPPSADGYLALLKTQLQQQNPNYTFSEPSAQTIGGVTFTKMQATLPYQYKDDVYATQRNGYYIFFIQSYQDDVEKSLFDEVLTSVELE